ncbi:MAG: hypothetical protein IMY70_06365, partial [Bacteroidetes bacterium]|nr:hypothetical protein [Bacteroidota bacterium]
MNENYLCPKCKGLLNVGEHLVFIIKTKSPRKGLIFLSPEIGNYKVIKHTYFELEEGEKTDFFCPICHFNLKFSRNKSLARIEMKDADQNKYEILFSRVVGEKCTYKIKGDKITEYGNHTSRYTNFIKSLQSDYPYK